MNSTIGPEGRLLRAVSYARLSTGTQAQSGRGTEAQHRARHDEFIAGRQQAQSGLGTEAQHFDADLTGKAAQEALDAVGITLNRNAISDDPRSPFVTSGLRMGTPSVTTQRMGPDEMAKIAEFTARVLRTPDDEAVIAQVRSEVAELCSAYPPYES